MVSEFKVVLMQASPLSGQLPVQRRSLRPRAGTLLGLAILAVAMHGLIWWTGASGKPPIPPSPAVTLIQLRAVTARPLPPVDAAANAAPPPSASLIETARPAKDVPSPLPQRPVSVPPPDIHAVSEAASAPALAEVPPAAVPMEPSTEHAPPNPNAQALPGLESEVLVYRVALPPGFTTAYEFRRGALTGQAELTWTPTGGRYALRLEARIGGVGVMTQTSDGRFDVTGLEPERFVDKRLGRQAHAANFQRDKGVISFSGPANTYTWQLGAQDRLSWMIQLPAILAAEPQRLTEGQRFAMVVVGARGEADVWTFRVVGWDRVDTPSGTVQTAKLLREPRRPHDPQVEIWVDPEQHYLPVRARWGGAEDPHPVELLRK